MKCHPNDRNESCRTECRADSAIASGRPRIFWITQDATHPFDSGASAGAFPPSCSGSRSGAVVDDPLSGSDAFEGLACGIADHFNDLLMGLQGWVSVIRLDHREGTLQSRHLRRMDAMIHSGALRILQLLSIAGRGVFSSPSGSGREFVPFVGNDRTLMAFRPDTHTVDEVVAQWRDITGDQMSIPAICRALTMDFADLFFQIERQLPELTGDTPDHRVHAIEALIEKGKDFLRQLYRVASAAAPTRRSGSRVEGAVSAAVGRWLQVHPSRRDIFLVHGATAGDAAVAATEAQIQGIVSTLLQNASDAMPAGGKIQIDTSRVAGPGTPSYIDGLPDTEAYVRIAVTDTGHGMDPDTMTQMFSPFFSTRIRKDRLGVGLAALYGRVKALDGYIHVHSRMGQGTTMVVLLPEAAPPKIAFPSTRPISVPLWQTHGDVQHVPLQATA